MTLVIKNAICFILCFWISSVVSSDSDGTSLSPIEFGSYLNVDVLVKMSGGFQYNTEIQVGSELLAVDYATHLVEDGFNAYKVIDGKLVGYASNWFMADLGWYDYFEDGSPEAVPDPTVYFGVPYLFFYNRPSNFYFRCQLVSLPSKAHWDVALRYLDDEKIEELQQYILDEGLLNDVCGSRIVE